MQLALWLPPGSPSELCSTTSSSGGGDSSSNSPPSTSTASCLVLLLDLLALPQAAAKRALQRLFRCVPFTRLTVLLEGWAAACKLSWHNGVGSRSTSFEQ